MTIRSMMIWFIIVSTNAGDRSTLRTYVCMRHLRGAILNRTYGTHKNLYISLFCLTIFGPIYYGPLVISW